MEKIDANNVFEMSYNAGDVVVLMKKRVGDPYMILMKSPIFFHSKNENGTKGATFCCAPEKVSLYNHRLFEEEPIDPMGGAMDVRPATEDERREYFKAVAKHGIESMFHSLKEGTSERWSWRVYDQDQK